MTHIAHIDLTYDTHSSHRSHIWHTDLTQLTHRSHIAHTADTQISTNGTFWDSQKYAFFVTCPKKRVFPEIPDSQICHTWQSIRPAFVLYRPLFMANHFTNDRPNRGPKILDFRQRAPSLRPFFGRPTGRNTPFFSTFALFLGAPWAMSKKRWKNTLFRIFFPKNLTLQNVPKTTFSTNPDISDLPDLPDPPIRISTDLQISPDFSRFLKIFQISPDFPKNLHFWHAQIAHFLRKTRFFAKKVLYDPIFWSNIDLSARSDLPIQRSARSDRSARSANPDLQSWQISRSGRSPDLADLQIWQILRFATFSTFSRFLHFSRNVHFSHFSHISGFPDFPTFPDFRKFPHFPHFQISTYDTHSSHSWHTCHTCHWLLALSRAKG